MSPVPAAKGVAAIGDLILGYRGAKVLFTAARMDLFTRLGRRRLSADALAAELRLHPRPARAFLDSLCALGFLEKSGGCYRNDSEAFEVLSRSRRGYLGDNLEYQDSLWAAWSDLERVLRRGRPVRPLLELLSSGRAFGRDYIRAMDNIASRPARELAAMVPCPPGARLLDVGAGAGTYSAAWLERNTDMTAALLDLPSTLRHTRALMRGRPASLRRRLRFVPCDYLKDSFGREVADLVLLSHVTHDEGEAANLRLLRKAWKALRPGGSVVVHDFMTGSDGTSPVFGALFSVHLLVYTRQGRVYSEADYRRLLRRAGFRRLRRIDICPDAPNATRAIVARKV